MKEKVGMEASKHGNQSNSRLVDLFKSYSKFLFNIKDKITQHIYISLGLECVKL